MPSPNKKTEMKRDRTGKGIGRLGMVGLKSTLGNHWSALTVHEGPGREVSWDQSLDQYTVRDLEGSKLAWTELQPLKVMRIRMENGELLPDFAIQKGWLRRYKHLTIGGENLRPVFMLEGNIRVVGNEIIRVEHRDFKSEVTYICTPEMEMAALVVAFLVFNTPNCGGKSG